MKISYDWLKSYIDINEEPIKLAEILTAIGLEVEGMEDGVFEIGLTPNRIDAASHIGVARDLAAWSCTNSNMVPYRRPSVEAFRPGSAMGVAVEVDAPDGAPRYAGITLEGIKVGPSPEWLLNRLHAIGVRPINNVVDVTNFVLHETGQPLHAFDRARIEGNVVKVRYAVEGERFVTLDGVERVLSSQDLMICNAVNPMCMAGIFGGIQSGVTEQTTSIFLESAYFDPVTIRKSSKRHGIKTDASFRYERGADPDMVPYALKRATLLLQEITGAKVVSAPVDYYPHTIKPAQIELAWEPLYALMGVRIDKTTVKTILQGLECAMISENEEAVTVQVPLYRVDVTRACDLAEEILRIWGYNRVEIPARITASVAPIVKPNPEHVRDKMQNLLVANGFNEIICNSLTPASWYESCSSFPEERLVRLLNPLSSDTNVMRQTLLFGGLEAIAYNTNRQYNDLRLFEYGNIYVRAGFTPAQCATLNSYRESPRVAIWMTGLAEPQQWRQATRPSHFFSLKGYLELLFTSYGLSLFNMESDTAPQDIFSQGVLYSIQGNVLAYMGVIQKKIMHRFGIKQEVFAAEICWDVLINAIKDHQITCTELPRYPEVRRDLALVLDEAVPYDHLRRIAFQTERHLLKRVTLFDVYRGEKLPAGKKQYAIGFMLQDIDKTLTDNDVDSVMSHLLSAFERETGAALRL